MPPRRPTETGVESRIDALFRAPLEDFVRERNGLASALKREKLVEAAGRVKALAKPSPGAWALNQVFWEARDEYDRMLRAGDALRRLQQQMLAGRPGNPRDTMAERQAAVNAVVERAVARLRAAGNAVTPATRQRVATTADALASYGSQGADYTHGRLTTDLDAPGFAALATLGSSALRLVHGSHPTTQKAATSRPPSPPTAPVDHRAERQAAREREAAVRRETAERARAVRAAEQALRDATRELEAARQRAARANASVEEIASEQQTLEEQLARLATRRRAAESAAASAAEAVEAAERTRRDAEAALTAAREPER